MADNIVTKPMLEEELWANLELFSLVCLTGSLAHLLPETQGVMKTIASEIGALNESELRQILAYLKLILPINYTYMHT